MRDFGTEVMLKRDFIFDNIKSVFEKYGFQAIQTPAMESIEVLTGKYGEEGEQLLYRILNSGDYLHKKGKRFVDIEDLELGESHLNTKIADKGLRYDLTVPFARFVASNFHELAVPFKRYQIQPVWRADRPQKGRYREFYQCDADFVGSDSLLNEAEIMCMIAEVFERLKIKDYSIVLNHRLILNDLSQMMGVKNQSTFFTILDKLDKIGRDGVIEELRKNQFEQSQLDQLSKILNIGGENSQILTQLEELLPLESKGIMDLKEVLRLSEKLGMNQQKISIDPSLARGLGYYTGTILEVKIKNSGIGSVSGGGRYDDLTGVFGLENVSGVGFSFGIDRIYDAMENLNLFPDEMSIGTKILISHFDEAAFEKGLELLHFLRSKDIASEIYPESAKMKKQLNFANKKNIPFVVMIGDEEIKSGKFLLKNMKSGEQEHLNSIDILDKV